MSLMTMSTDSILPVHEQSSSPTTLNTQTTLVETASTRGASKADTKGKNGQPSIFGAKLTFSDTEKSPSLLAGIKEWWRTRSDSGSIPCEEKPAVQGDEEANVDRRGNGDIECAVQHIGVRSCEFWSQFKLLSLLLNGIESGQVQKGVSQSCNAAG